MNELHPHLTDFTVDWLQREPALALCQRFALKPPHWLAAVVLIEELLQAMFGLSKLELAQAKLAWWADEAHLTQANTPRHPLTLAMCAAGQNVGALPSLTQSALDWLVMPTAADANTQRSQFSSFAAAASQLVNEGDCTAMWIELALKRQLQSYAKPERYGPGAFNRATLAEYQLKATQISDSTRIPNAKVSAALCANLTDICQTLRGALASNVGTQSAMRAYGLLHAREAAIWAKFARTPVKQLNEHQLHGHQLLTSPPGMIGLLQAWWIARA